MNANPKVDDFLRSLDHPYRDEIQALRQIVLGVDSCIQEEIKWGAPTFTYKGNMATYNVRAKKFVNLTFHTGAHIKDPAGLLQGEAKEARVARFVDMDDVHNKKGALEAVVKAWIVSKDF
jgi:hypothetical protein